MSDHRIRFATLDDVDAIMKFIETHWKSNHILAVNRTFFLYEYGDGERVNFVLAIDESSKELVGVCGFIKNTKDRNGSDIWGSLWKVIKTNNPMLGLNILEYIPENTGCRTFSSCGIAPKTLPIYEFLRFRTGKLKQFYRLKDKKEYSIATVREKVILPYESPANVSCKTINHVEELVPFLENNSPTNRKPYKDSWYLEKRYFNHPVYSYKVFGVATAHEKGILVAREIIYGKSKVLRIIDFMGSGMLLSALGPEFQKLLDENDYEYLDCYCEGIDAERFNQAGLKERDGNDSNTIPNYFEPFVPENIDIYFFTNTEDKITIFKGDGDQDRPSLVNHTNE